MAEWQGGLEEADRYNRINSAMDVKDSTWELREKSAWYDVVGNWVCLDYLIDPDSVSSSSSTPTNKYCGVCGWGDHDGWNCPKLSPF